jgi:Spy/CpxP family protein refolding chaperone
MKSQAEAAFRLRRLGIGVALAALVGAAACAATVDDKRQDDEITAKELSLSAQRHFRGPVDVVIDAARARGSLTTEQARRLRVIESELGEERTSRRETRQKLRDSAVTIIRSGTASSAEFDRAVKEAVSVLERRMDQSVDALVEIHGILDAGQRTAVAAELQARIDERFQRSHDDRHHRGSFDRLAAHLMLSTFQIDKLRAMKKELMGEKERLRPSRQDLSDLAVAFASDGFPAALEAFRAKKTRVLRARFAKAGERTDTVLTLLTPEQRSLLADLIQDGPEKVLLGQHDSAGQ